MHVDGALAWRLRTGADLRTLLPLDATLLGRYQSQEVSFLAGQFGVGGSVKGQRSMVYLKPAQTVLILDWIIPGTNAGPWQWTYTAPEDLDAHVLMSDPYLITLQPKGHRAPELIREIDLIGVSISGWYIWFHRDVVSAQSAVSFLLEAGDDAQFLLTGLAPGAWEMWQDGWLQESPLRVPPEAGAAYWKGKRGSYFLRRLTR